MIAEEFAKAAIEQAELNCSGEEISYGIDEIKELSEDGAYLVIAHSDDCKTSFVAYEDGTCYFLNDWQGDYPKTEEEIAEYQKWVTIDWHEGPLVVNGLPRALFDL